MSQRVVKQATAALDTVAVVLLVAGAFVVHIGLGIATIGALCGVISVRISR
jgi:uncharacterized membrane protein YiaA